MTALWVEEGASGCRHVPLWDGMINGFPAGVCRWCPALCYDIDDPRLYAEAVDALLRSGGVRRQGDAN